MRAKNMMHTVVDASLTVETGAVFDDSLARLCVPHKFHGRRKKRVNDEQLRAAIGRWCGTTTCEELAILARTFGLNLSREDRVKKGDIVRTPRRFGELLDALRVISGDSSDAATDATGGVCKKYVTNLQYHFFVLRALQKSGGISQVVDSLVHFERESEGARKAFSNLRQELPNLLGRATDWLLERWGSSHSWDRKFFFTEDIRLLQDLSGIEQRYFSFPKSPVGGMGEAQIKLAMLEAVVSSPQHPFFENYRNTPGYLNELIRVGLGRTSCSRGLDKHRRLLRSLECDLDQPLSDAQKLFVLSRVGKILASKLETVPPDLRGELLSELRAWQITPSDRDVDVAYITRYINAGGSCMPPI